ncbi:MAG: hypothetical protein HKN87_05050 [Saprospiraceae bacterium]|nr:hypothetical protein [Saprospiraceae bacterium]
MNATVRMLVLCSFILWTALACTPKVAQELVEDTSKAEKVDSVKPVGPCGTFDQSRDKEQSLNAHVIYRDFLKQGAFDEAFPYWKVAYDLAPAADGRRNTHYADGIKFYEHFLAEETDTSRHQVYIDQIFKFYDQISVCYDADGYVAGRKAFDLYYKYKGRASQKEIYDLFVTSIEADGDEAQFFILNPFTDILVRRFLNDEIPLEEARQYEKMIRDRLQKGLESGKNQAQWSIINDYIPKRLEALEGVRGFYDCAYYSDKYFPLFLADSTNCEVIDEVYGKLKWGGCAASDEKLVAIDSARLKHCVVVVPPSESRLAYQALREGSYEDAVDLFEKAGLGTEDLEKKATYLLLISKIYYAHLKKFPLARKYALQAAEQRPDWGEPYLLIGRLYASSGPLCGPGRGWDSQIVVWPAIDKWNHAKRIDPTASAEANKWINTYAQYMPDKEDVFQRNLNEGDVFRVGCWIQENTRIRTAKK